MADLVTIKLTGFKELGDKLRAIGPDVAKNGLRTADFAGAKVIRDAAQQTVPVKTGLMQAQIVASHRHAPDNVAKYTILVKKPKVSLIAVRADTGRNRRRGRVGKYHQIAGPQTYGRFIEFGTSKMAANPFLRRATLQNVANAISAIKDGLAKALARAAK